PVIPAKAGIHGCHKRGGGMDSRFRRNDEKKGNWRSSGQTGRDMRLFLLTLLNGLTLAALYFLVASGFTLVFGLMRNVNLAHGSLYLLGAYVGWVVGEYLGSWFLAVAAGFVFAALMGLLLQVGVFRFMH